MARFSENNKYDITHPKPIFIVPEILPGEYFGMITDVAAPGVLPYYAISNYGRIWHIYANHFMSTSWDGPGYRIAVLRTFNGAKTYRVHRLLMMTLRYQEGCENLVVNHINGMKTRNYIDFPGIPDNLEWITPSVNEYPQYNNTPSNENHSNRLTAEIAKKICDEIELGNLTSREIAEINHTTLGIVENIRFGRAWRDISCKYNFMNKYK